MFRETPLNYFLLIVTFPRSPRRGSHRKVINPLLPTPLGAEAGGGNAPTVRTRNHKRKDAEDSRGHSVPAQISSPKSSLCGKRENLLQGSLSFHLCPSGQIRTGFPLLTGEEAVGTEVGVSGTSRRHGEREHVRKPLHLEKSRRPGRRRLAARTAGLPGGIAAAGPAPLRAVAPQQHHCGLWGALGERGGPGEEVPAGRAAPLRAAPGPLSPPSSRARPAALMEVQTFGGGRGCRDCAATPHLQEAGA